MNQVSLTWIEFVEQFKPITNTISDSYVKYGNFNYMFETYGKEDEFVRTFIEQNRVWTYTDIGNGTVVSEGYHWVNRLGYYITEVPWVDGVDYEIDLDLDTCEECEEVIEFTCQEDDGELTCTNCCGHEGCQ